MSLFEKIREITTFAKDTYTSEFSCELSAYVQPGTGEYTTNVYDQSTYKKEYKDMSSHVKLKYVSEQKRILDRLSKETLRDLFDEFSYVSEAPAFGYTHEKSPYGFSIRFYEGNLENVRITPAFFARRGFSINISAENLSSASYMERLEKILRFVDVDTGYGAYTSTANGKEIVFKAPVDTTKDVGVFFCERLARAPSSIRNKKSFEKALDSGVTQSYAQLVMPSDKRIAVWIDEICG